MQKDVKIIQAVAGIESINRDKEKEIAKLLNKGYTIVSCVCTSDLIVWTLVRDKSQEEYIQNDMKNDTGCCNNQWKPWGGGKNPAPGKWVKYELRSGAQYADYSDNLDWSHSSLGAVASSYDIVAFQE